MRNFKLVVTWSIALLLFVSCRKDQTGPKPNVYLSGFYKNLNGVTSACYWKNGTFVPLGANDATEQSYASDILVDNGKVYVVGNVLKDNIVQPCIWVNGQIAYLFSQVPQIGSSEKINIKNGEIFISGFYSVSNKPFCIKYALGTPVFMSNSSGNTSGIDFDDQGRVLVAGIFGGFSGYWLQGVWVGSTTNSSYSAGIKFYNSDIYIGADNITKAEVGYLKNNIFNALGPSATTTISGIFLANNKLYLAGSVLQNSISNAVMWDNTNIVVLSTQESYTNDIECYANKVYIAGDNEGKACYWENTTLISMNKPSSSASAIFIEVN